MCRGFFVWHYGRHFCGACHGGWCKVENFQFIDCQHFFLQWHIRSLTCQFVGAVPVDFDGGIGRRFLLDCPDKVLQFLFDPITRDMLEGIEAVK